LSGSTDLTAEWHGLNVHFPGLLIDETFSHGTWAFSETPLHWANDVRTISTGDHPPDLTETPSQIANTSGGNIVKKFGQTARDPTTSARVDKLAQFGAFSGRQRINIGRA
jgi:hypothetical protein